LVAGDETCGDDTANAEESSVAEGGEDARCEEEVIGGGDGAGQVAEGENAHEEEKRELALQTGGGDGYDGRADGDGERVAGDEDARLGDADVKVVGKVGQQTHDDELGGADAEGCNGQRH